MAYDPHEQYRSQTGPGSGKRFYAESIQPKTFAAGSALLAVGTPVAFNTSTNQWVVWANAGANGTNLVKAFVWPDPIQLKAGVEVLGNVMLKGRAHFADIVVPGGETEANLKAALRGTVRNLGFIIEGLENFY